MEYQNLHQKYFQISAFEYFLALKIIANAVFPSDMLCLTMEEQLCDIYHFPGSCRNHKFVLPLLSSYI